MKQDDAALPHDLEAEKALIGAVIFDNRQMPLALERLPVGEETRKEPVFFGAAHQAIWGAMLGLYESGTKAFDLTIVASRLLEMGKLESVGGAAYIGGMLEDVFLPQQAPDYAEIVAKCWQQRRMIKLAKAIEQGAAKGRKADEIAQQAEAAIRRITEISSRGGFVHISEPMRESEEKIELVRAGKAHASGLLTGYDQLDGMLLGMRPGSMNVLAGRPSTGKTAFACNVVANVAMRSGKGVAVFSLEMENQELVDRMIAAEATLELTAVRTAKLDNYAMGKFREARERINRAPIYLDDTARVRTRDLHTRLARLRTKCSDLALIVIDYLQLVTADDQGAQENERFTQISRDIKILAKEAGLPVLVLSQLSRETEKRQASGAGVHKPKEAPRLSDLRGSGSIEQDADVVIFTHRPWEKGTDKEDFFKAIVAKNRNGPCGSVAMDFIGKYQRISELAKD